MALSFLLNLINDSLLRPLVPACTWSRDDFPLEFHELVDNIKEYGQFIILFSRTTDLLTFDPRQFSASMRGILSVLSQQSRAGAEVKNGLADIILKLKEVLVTVTFPTPVRPENSRSEREAKLFLVDARDISFFARVRCRHAS